MTDYVAIGKEIGELVTKKNAVYGNSFGDSGAVMLKLYPNGIGPDQVDDALTIVRIIDKLFRIATKKDALGESPYRDIAGYALLAVGRDECRKIQTDAGIIETGPFTKMQICPACRGTGCDHCQLSGKIPLERTYS